MNHRILLAEDDARLASLVKDFLESQAEFTVAIEANGNKVARQLKNLCPDILILDVGLPHKDGLTVCKEVRADFKGPILILTARDSDRDQIAGLECGADDFVIKPVEPAVLLARLKALLRRYPQDDKGHAEQLHFGGLTIHCASRTLTLEGEEVTLSSHEFDLVLALARQAGNVLSREYLFNVIYARPYDGMDRTIDVRVSQLRKKLGDSAEAPFRIKTVWGRGYLFVADAW